MGWAPALSHLPFFFCSSKLYLSITSNKRKHPPLFPFVPSINVMIQHLNPLPPPSLLPSKKNLKIRIVRNEHPPWFCLSIFIHNFHTHPSILHPSRSPIFGLRTVTRSLDSCFLMVRTYFVFFWVKLLISFSSL